MKTSDDADVLDFVHPEDPGWLEMPDWPDVDQEVDDIFDVIDPGHCIAFLASRQAPVDRADRLHWDDLAELLTTPVIGPKDGPAWMPADIDPGPRQRERVRSLTLLALDIEAHSEGQGDAKKAIGPEPADPAAMLAELSARGWRSILHTTHSHRADHPRYRIVLDISRPLAPSEVRPLGEHVALLLGVHDACDLKCLEPARLLYLPRIRERSADFRAGKVRGAPLDVDALLAAARATSAIPDTPQSHTRVPQEGAADVIGAFNARWSPGEIMERNGYKREGKRWLFLGSSSGIPGIVELPASDPPRVFSHHSGDPLANGHACDAFHCFAVLEHGGDVSAAVREAADLLGLTAGRQTQAPRTALHYDPDTGEVLEDDPDCTNRGVRLDDFRAYMPAHSYIFMPSGEFWPSSSVNSRLGAIKLFDADGMPLLDEKGKQKSISPSLWLDQNRPVEQLTWAPGEPPVVANRLISDGGWIVRAGCSVFNLYRPPNAQQGEAELARPWIDHIRRVYPADAEHLIKWFAHRAQCPAEKINHAIVLGGCQGIGKDTMLEPVKAAIGPWNFSEVSPQHLLGRFNGFAKSVILRVSEARDLGDVDRFAFYDHMKTYTAAPPDVLRVDEKHVREYSVFNVCGVIITTNHKADGIFLPSDDRRHYVAWSDCTRDEFPADYWTNLYQWYSDGGTSHVVAYLRTLSLDEFDAKAPPPKTPAFWDIVASNQAPEDAELADALDNLQHPDVVTVARVAEVASDQFAEWLRDRRNSRRIPHRFEECGYVAVRNPHASDGMFKVGGKRCAVYAKRSLSLREQIQAASSLIWR